MLKYIILLLLIAFVHAQIKSSHLPADQTKYVVFSAHRQTCPEKMHSCELNGICVSSDLICDGLDHCGNNRDEKDCSFMQHMQSSAYRRNLLIKTLFKMMIFALLLALVKTLTSQMKCFQGRRQYRSASFYFGTPIQTVNCSTPVNKQDSPPDYSSIVHDQKQVACIKTELPPPSYKDCMTSINTTLKG